MSSVTNKRASKAQQRVEAAVGGQEASAQKSFIVQHIGAGFHCVSDLGITFGPFEVKDLTNEDSSLVRRSRDLRRSIIMGDLIEISEEDADAILHEEAARLRAQTMQASRKRATQMRQIQAGDRTLDAEMVNLSQGDSNNLADEVSAMSAGSHNDPVTYAMAFRAAREEAVAHGQVPPSPREFAQRVANNRGLVQRYATAQQGVVSGVEGRARATVLTPPSYEGQGMGVAQVPMSNYNRDQYVAGMSDAGISSFQHEVDDLPMAEQIDLLEDDGEDLRESGAIRPIR